MMEVALLVILAITALVAFVLVVMLGILIFGGIWKTERSDGKMAYGFEDDKSIVEVFGKSDVIGIENGGTGANSASESLANLGITIGTAAAPATGTPNTIYIQMV